MGRSLIRPKVSLFSPDGLVCPKRSESQKKKEMEQERKFIPFKRVYYYFTSCCSKVIGEEVNPSCFEGVRGYALVE